MFAFDGKNKSFYLYTEKTLQKSIVFRVRACCLRFYICLLGLNILTAFITVYPTRKTVSAVFKEEILT